MTTRHPPSRTMANSSSPPVRPAPCPHLAAELAAGVRTERVAVQEFPALHLVFGLQIHKGQVRLRPNLDPALLGPQVETHRDVVRGETRDGRKIQPALVVSFGEEQRQR